MCVHITAGRYTPDLKTTGFLTIPMMIYKIISRTFPNSCDMSKRKHHDIHGSIFSLFQLQQWYHGPVVNRAGRGFCQNWIKILILPLTICEALCTPSLKLFLCEMVVGVK